MTDADKTFLQELENVDDPFSRRWSIEVERAYSALDTASRRMGFNNYQLGLSQHVKAGRKAHTYRYQPTEAHRQLVSAKSDLLKGLITPEEAMALLHEYDVFKQRLGT